MQESSVQTLKARDWSLCDNAAESLSLHISKPLNESNAQDLAECILQNRSIISLGLSNARLSETAGQALSNALRFSSPSLTVVEETQRCRGSTSTRTRSHRTVL